MACLNNTNPYDIAAMKRGAKFSKTIVNCEFDPENSSLFTFSFNSKTEPSSKNESNTSRKTYESKEVSASQK